METYWEGWGKKTGKENKRWKRRYLRLHGMEGGARGLFYYDDERATGTKGAIPFKEASGVVHFTGTDDLKFAILTPGRVWLLGFDAADREHGLRLLQELYTVLNKVDVLKEGWLAKKRHTLAPPGAMAVWRKQYFIYIATGELLFFSDASLSSLQGRVNVRHSPRLRFSGAPQAASRSGAPGGVGPCPPCLVSVSVAQAKPLLLRLHAGGAALPDDARAWLDLLRHGHAANKHSLLERCVSSNNFHRTPEVRSAVAAGAPDEIRGSLWKGLSGAQRMQRAAPRALPGTHTTYY